VIRGRRRVRWSSPGTRVADLTPPSRNEGAGEGELAQQFANFATTAGRDGAALYQQICDGVAENRQLLALMGSAPPDQRRPNLLLAAVHFLLLSGVEHPLGDSYDTVAAWRGTPVERGAPRRDAFADFEDFCRRYRNQVGALLATRGTQTNEIGRCSALLPAFATVATTRDEPLAIVDLGTSAGLNLLFDRYAYDYGRPRPVGSPDSVVTLRCNLREDRDLPLVLPTVSERIGIDQSPIHVADPDESRWLLACQWPGHLARFERLRQALDIARRTPVPLRIEQGDFVDRLVSVVAEVTDDAHLCVFHSWAAAYLSEDRQHDLTASLRYVARNRPVSWIFAESPHETPGLPHPPAPRHIKGATALVLVELDGTTEHARRLGDMHPHGAWLHWWDVSTDA